MSDELEEYSKRLVPPSDEEIITLAKRLWAEPRLRALFERVGYHGNLNAEEAEAVKLSIDAYRQGDLWDRDYLHLALAPCLLRQLAAGMIDSLDSPEIRIFLADRRVARGGPMMRPAQTSLREVVDFAKAIKNDPDAWAMIMRLSEYPDLIVREVDRSGVLAHFESNYRYKYGLWNRGLIGAAIGHLRAVAAGTFESIDCPEAQASLQHTLDIAHNAKAKRPPAQ